MQVVKHQEPDRAVVRTKLGPAAGLIGSGRLQTGFREIGGIEMGNGRPWLAVQPFGSQSSQQPRFADARGSMNHQRRDPLAFSAGQRLCSRKSQLVFRSGQEAVPGMGQGGLKRS